MSTTVNVTTPASKPTVYVSQDGDVTVDISYNPVGTTSGDVYGPASSTDNAIARFDGTTGKVIQNSGITIADGATGTLSGSNSGDVTIGTANGLSLAGQALSLTTASSSTTGALTSTDWNTFNSKQSALTTGNLTTSTTGVSVTGGTGAVIGSGAAVNVQTANGSQPGLLSSADWNTFNGKQASGNYITALTGDVTASGPGSAVATLANTAVTPGAYTNANITVDSKGRITAAANGSSGSTGTVTSVSVTTANGVSGTVANPTTTPAISLTLGAITPSSVSSAGSITGSNLSGTNTGDVSLASSVTDVLALTGQAISGVDQGSDKLVFWDESANKLTSLTVGSGLSISGTTISSTGTGGDVVGPSSSTDNALVRFDGTTGKLVQNGQITQSDTGDLAAVNSIAMDTTPSGSLTTQGQMMWNTGEETLDIQLNGFTLHVGEHVVYHVKNSTGSTIAKGVPVMYAGTTGNSGQLLIQPWNGAGPATLFMGLTAESLTNGSEGFVIAFGKLRGIQTNGANYGETWTDGEIIYAGLTSGSLTDTVPSAPNPIVEVMAVVHAHASNGTVFIRPNYTTGDVFGPSSATDDNVAVFDGTTGKVIKDGGTFSSLIASSTNASTSKSTPVDADEVPLIDSQSSFSLKKLTWANLKATAKTYFDTLYQPLATILTNFSGLSNSAGVLTNNGAGTLSYTATSTGGNGSSDNAKLAIYNSDGSLMASIVKAASFNSQLTNVRLEPTKCIFQDGIVTLTVQSAGTTGTCTLKPGTVITSSDTGTVTDTMLAGSITNAKLVNSSITINGTPVSLGGSTTIATGITIGSTAITGGTSGRLLTSGSTVGEQTLGTGVATALAVNIGSTGAFVTNGGALGTPSSGTLTSCTGLPISTGVSGLGTNVATSLANNMSTSGTLAILGANTFTGSQTITPSTNNVNALALNGVVSGAGVSRALISVSDNWQAATGGTSAPRLLDMDITDTGGSLNFGLTGFVRFRRNSVNVLTIDQGGTFNVGNGGCYIDTNINKLQVASNWFLTIAGDASLYRDAANILAQRNGTTAQALRVYNTRTSATNLETFAVDWQTTANTCLVGTSKGSGGGTARPMSLITDGTARINIGAAGELGLYGVTAVARATTAVAAATFVANTSGIANDTATFDGYTIGQVVKALRNVGILT